VKHKLEDCQVTSVLCFLPLLVRVTPVHVALAYNYFYSYVAMIHVCSRVI